MGAVILPIFPCFEMSYHFGLRWNWNVFRLKRPCLIAKLNSQQTLLDYAMRDLLRKVESFGTVKIGKHKLIPLDIDVAALLNPDL